MYLNNTARSTVLGLIAAALPFAAALWAPLTAQTPVRIPTPLQVRSVRDNGALSASTHLQHMRVLLTPSAAQQKELRQFLADLRTPGSPNYHRWLKPEEFGARFGVSAADETKVKAWLSQQGFTNLQTSNSRTAIVFDGTIGTAQAAFKTEIHSLTINGENRFSNVKELTIPSEISGVVTGVRGLSDLRMSSQSIRLKPQFTYTQGSSNTPEFAPGDIATMYDIQSLYNAGINGSGVTVAVLGDSDIDPTDIAAYQSGFGLPANPPTQVLVPGSADPGFVAGDQEEASLDLELVSAVARGSNLLYVYGSDNYAALEYAIDNNVANVISMSFGTCEPALVAAGSIYWYELLAEQANAEGITLINASGDTGPAACDVIQETSATQGSAVYFPADLPEVTGVGGTSTVYPYASYFGATNASDGGSLTSYIPEISWNDTPSQGHLQSSGGGASVAFSKPGWQQYSGVPTDGARDVPDVSLFALDAEHGFGYIYCFSGNCTGQPNGFTSGAISGGTSATAPLFAGIVALLNNYLVANNQLSAPGLGNINPQLYLLANNTSNVFHDVTQGNNIVPCANGSSNCATGSFGYSAGPGYDQVTGLGSVDVANLATQWTSTSVLGSKTTLASSNSSGVSDGSAVTFTAKVSAAGTQPAPPTPSGSVSFYDNLNTTNNGGKTTNLLATVALDGTGTATWTGVLLGDGLHTITAVYTGTSQYNESTSPGFLQTVEAPSTLNIAAPSTTTWQQGSSVSFNVQVQPTSGTYPQIVGSNGFMQTVNPTGTVTFYLGSTALGSINIAQTQTFTTSNLPAGTDNVTAAYSGDSYYESSTSTNAAMVTIQSSAVVNTTTMLNVTPSSVAYGGSVIMTATVTPASGNTAPIGSVTFMDGSTTLGTAALTNGIATFTSSSLQVGNNAIQASYSGVSGTFAASVSSVVNVNEAASASASTTTTLVPSVTQPALGSSVTLTATVASSSGNTAPTGTVSFFISGTLLGTATLSNGVAAFTTSSLPLGSNSVTASYAGASGFSASTSAAVTVTVVQPDFTIAANPSSISTTSGNSANTTIVLTPLNGFNSTVTLACSGLPTGDTCTFGSATSANGTITYPLTITTVKSSMRGGSGALAFLPLAALFAFRRRKSLQSILGIALATVTLVSVLGITGCSVSGQTYSSPAPQPTGNSSTIVVTATTLQGTSHTTSIVLAVN